MTELHAVDAEQQPASPAEPTAETLDRRPYRLWSEPKSWLRPWRGRRPHCDVKGDEPDAS